MRGRDVSAGAAPGMATPPHPKQPQQHHPLTMNWKGSHCSTNVVVAQPFVTPHLTRTKMCLLPPPCIQQTTTGAAGHGDRA